MSGEVVKQEDDDECRSPPASAAVVSASAGKHTVILKTPSRDVPLEEALLHCAPLLDPNSSSCSSTSVRLGLHPQDTSSPAPPPPHLASSASFTPPEQEGTAGTGACAPREDRFSATEWGESDQPWYSYLYSPVSLENSPPQNLLDPGVADLHCMQGPPPPLTTGYQAPQYPLEDPCPPQGVMDPSQQIPFTVKMEEARHSELMAAMDMPTHEPEGGVAGGGGVGGGGWMVEAAPGLWPVKVEPWITPHHSRYVSEDGSYWLAAAGWQVGSSGPGVMEGGVGLGSPGEDPTASPSDEASTSDAKRPDSKKCGVCGDRALGYNFNAITCESCKAFFRRNALKNKEFRCPFQDSCKVDTVTRRFCQKCRLRKCFEIGMKKEWIMTEEEKQRKKQKIEENRARKMGDAVSDEEKLVDTVSGAKHPAPAYSPFPVTPAESSKPQAVVVGVIRGEEEALAKVLRVEGQTDVHSQDRLIIHSTGNTSERVPLPSTLVSASRDYSSDFSNSSEHNVLPQCSGDQEYGSSMAHSAIVSQFLPYSHDVTSPGKPPSVGSILDHRNLIPYSEQKGFTLTNDDTSSTQADQEAREGSPSMGGSASPTASNPGNTMSMAEVMAMNIKKEVEYPEENVSLCANDEHIGQEVQTHTDDTWKNFSVQDTLRLLEPGCKQSSGATGLTMMDSIMNTAISAEYSAFSLLGSNNPRELNEPEKVKLSELSEANKGLLAPLCEDYNFKDLSNPSLINIINLTEIAIRRLIKMSKRISAFKSLCQEDQIALLKGGCTEMMILRSVCAYDPDKDSWMIQQDHDRFKNIKLKVLKAAPGNVYEEHKRFILAFQPEWRQDHNIIFLLSAITLFTPERPNIIHGDAIKHEQCSYLYLLKRYLECKYGGCEGRTVYLRLLERIKHLHILNENHIRVFLEVNPQEVEPLLIEIFDLKHR